MDTKIIHITAAQGPLECQLAVSKVLSLLFDSLRNLGGKCEVLDRKIGDANGTLHSATIEIKGKAAIDESKNWIGTIQWIQKIALENTEIQLKMIAQKWMQHKNLERGNAVKVFQN